MGQTFHYSWADKHTSGCQNFADTQNPASCEISIGAPEIVVVHKAEGLGPHDTAHILETKLTQNGQPTYTFSATQTGVHQITPGKYYHDILARVTSASPDFDPRAISIIYYEKA